MYGVVVQRARELSSTSLDNYKAVSFKLKQQNDLILDALNELRDLEKNADQINITNNENNEIEEDFEENDLEISSEDRKILSPIIMLIRSIGALVERITNFFKGQTPFPPFSPSTRSFLL